VHPDPLGSPDVLTDEQGQRLEPKSYEAFGAPRNADWRSVEPPLPSLTSLGFTGHEDDRELGLVNMRGRVYDPVVARFLTPDAVVQAPSFSPSWNPYSYAFHSPLRYTDPSGWQVEGEGADPY
jgi:RHS repeat-associated protein